jgi:UDP-N-acetylglucosamine 2-epimerase (non-hydrolysing)
MGFKDFLSLEKHARLIISDSGTVCEESCILGVPGVILRDGTERPETIEAGCNILSGVDPDSILRCAEIMLNRKQVPSCPAGYMAPAVSETVCNIVLGYL